MEISDGSPVILFDGYCNLCSFFVSLVLPRDPDVLFASLRSDEAAELAERYDVDIIDEVDSIVYIEDGVGYVRSDAVLRVFKRLGLPYSVFYVFVVVPRPLRDLGYRFVARTRYRVFGEKDECMVPDPDERKRFLDMD